MERVRTEFYSSSISESSLPDGWVKVESLTSCTHWMASWLMSFGPEAEVISPAELREEIRGMAEKLAARYAPAGIFSVF
jgi:predicted DNA-binding transcriptional regulator YafY